MIFKNIPNLIHIGLHKTGSTALQNAWSARQDINLCWQNISPFFEKINNIDCCDGLESTSLNFEHTAKKAKCNVYSSEVLSTCRLGKNDIYAQVLKNKVPQAIILLVVRSPISWLFSLYKQYIQEGGEKHFQGFIQAKEYDISYSASINNLYNIWSYHYGEENILILPFEMLKKEPERFSLLLQQKIGVDIVNQLPNVNQSISDTELEFMRSVSSTLHHIEKHAEWSPLSFRRLKKELLLLVRSELQHKGSLSTFINRAYNEPEITLNIPDDLLLTLVNEHYGFLKRHYGSFYGYLNIYANELGISE